MASAGTLRQGTAGHLEEPAWAGLVRPIIGGLVLLVALLGLIGSAIHDPKPHDVPVGAVGPGPAVRQLSGGIEKAAPGAFSFTAFDSEEAARAALDSRSVDGVLVLGAPAPRLVLAGASGDGSTGVISGVFTAAFKAQGASLAVETVHPFSSGDSHGLVLFFAVVAVLISTLVAAALLGAAGRRYGLGMRFAALFAFGILAGPAAMATSTWIAGDYGTGFWAAAGLLALVSVAAGTVIAGSARLLGTPGLGLAALVVVLLDLVTSGGPLGSRLLPDFYRWLAPGMPAGQVYGGLKSVLYFDAAGLATPLEVLAAWLLGGIVLMLVAEAVANRRRLAPKAVA
jgi:hypothetical protein